MSFISGSNGTEQNQMNLCLGRQNFSCSDLQNDGNDLQINGKDL
jgi:hypothetical protein